MVSAEHVDLPSAENWIEDGVINSDHVEFFHPVSDESVKISFTSGDSLVTPLSVEQLEELFDTYDIKVYDN